MNIGQLVTLEKAINYYNNLEEEDKKLLLPTTISLVSAILDSINLTQLLSKHPTDINILNLLLEKLISFNQSEFKGQIDILKMIIEYKKYN